MNTASEMLLDLTTLQNHLASIVESSDDAIISKDLNGIIKSWNPGAQRIFGYTKEEAIGRHISMLAPPGRADEIPQILARIASGDRIDHYQTKRVTKDGRILSISLTVSPIRDCTGKIVGASKIARDVTHERRHSELQERLAAIVESSDDAIISKDLNGIIQTWNRGAERMFGYTSEEAVGRHISFIAAPERVQEIPRILARIARGERVDHYETRRRAKDGRILEISLTVSPIRDGTGKIIGASKIARDITDQMRYQKALRDANESLSRSNADLEQFTYCASHDLQEPLRMICSYSEMLKRKFAGKLGAEGDQYIDYVVTGISRMERLLRDLRAFTYASTSVNDELPEVDCNEVLSRTLDNLRANIDETGACVTHDPLPRVRVHEFQMEQLLQNLIANAIRYRSEQPPKIHVGVERSSEHWKFSVSDNGIGIDPQYSGQIFGIFKRLHSYADYPGTGMGLAICQRIVQRAGGSIWVESELGRGATFLFTLPAGDHASGGSSGEPPVHSAH